MLENRVEEVGEREARCDIDTVDKPVGVGVNGEVGEVVVDKEDNPFEGERVGVTVPVAVGVSSNKGENESDEDGVDSWEAEKEGEGEVVEVAKDVNEGAGELEIVPVGDPLEVKVGFFQGVLESVELHPVALELAEGLSLVGEA